LTHEYRVPGITWGPHTSGVSRHPQSVGNTKLSVVLKRETYTGVDAPMDFLSEIIQTLNDSFEGDFTDEDKIEKIRE
jgi:hypothetical protein